MFKFIKSLFKNDYTMLKDIHKKQCERVEKKLGWDKVCSAVTEVYNIKKGEITPKNTSSAKQKKTAGTIKVKGETIESLQIVYEGKLLTPTHFSMKPTARPKNQPATEGKKAKQAKPYTVTAEIIKGQRKALGSNVFLGANKGGGQIPYKRYDERSKLCGKVRRFLLGSKKACGAGDPKSSVDTVFENWVTR